MSLREIKQIVNREINVRPGFYGTLNSSLKFAYLPVRLDSGNWIWFKEYVHLSIPWSGQKASGTVCAYVAPEQYANLGSPSKLTNGNNVVFVDFRKG